MIAFVISAWLLLTGAMSPSRVSIDTYPRQVMFKETVRIRCTVPRHEDNRILSYGIQGVATSEIDWPGEIAPLTRTVFIKHVPCDPGLAYCAVTEASGKTYVATQTVEVAGCGI